MMGMTWVELFLILIFAGTLAFSVAFCLNNYTRSEPVKLAGKTGESPN